MRFTLVLTLIVSLGASAFCQKMSYREVDLPVHVRPQSVQLLYLDKEGFVWMAAGHSLYWNDGNGFREVEVPGRKDAHKISSLFQDSKNTLWVGWDNGDIDFLKGDTLKVYESKEGTPAVEIVGWAEDEIGQLWMATNGEGVYVKDISGRWYNFNTDEGLPSNDSYDITHFKKGVTVATDQGLVMCSFENGEKSIRVLRKKDGLGDQIVKSLCVDEGILNLAYYEPIMNSLDSNLSVLDTISTPNSEVCKILKSHGITWWLSEDGDLYKRIGNGEWEQLTFDPSNRKRINTFIRDDEGHLWVISSQGLFMVDQWYSHRSKDKEVRALFADDKELWYAQEGTLYRQNLRTNDIQKFWESSNLIVCICKDYWGNIWCGTFDGGLTRLNPSSGEMLSLTESSGLANNNVLSVSGSKPALWIGTLGGVSKLTFDDKGDVKTIESYDQKDGVSVQYIYSVHVSKDGGVYLGTDGEGILRWTDKGFMPLTKENRDDIVLDITTDETGNLWWVNADGVLRGWNAGVDLDVDLYGEELGEVAGLKAFKDSSILIFHEGGILRWQPNTKEWTAYKKPFGLGGFQPELHAYSKGKSDVVFIGESSGITRLVIDQLPKRISPETYLAKVQLFLKPSVESTFSSDENYLTFQYVGRWYTEPSGVHYKLMLEGFSPNWIESKNTEVAYPKLPPGSYTFKVVAGVDGKYPDAQMKQFSFVINQPWYFRWYSIAIGCFILVAMVWVIIRVRINMAKQSQEREKQKVQAQLEMLKSQVNPHFLFNSFNTLMALIEDDREEATSYLADLSDFFRSILEFRDVDLITVQEDVKIVETYLLLQSKRFGEALVTQISISNEVLATQIPPLTLQLLVENAFKHNIILKGTPLELKIESRGSCIVVTNKLRPRVNPDSSTGYGLDSIKRKYKFYSEGEVRTEQTEESFSVYLPLIYKNGMA